ncbi:hypothetical protein HK105_200361 [Polyrhizophydium stewartii]|uniref:NEDD8-activating enzyme E1 regulatory subunit n=1 Tax=Polyrhizophydium stewartii TaxID=2732419 RepID=A0ABR4NL73_9FUNG
MEPQPLKYDRQLRLWHAHGQQRRHLARICLVNAAAVGAEAVKNLASALSPSSPPPFTVVDDALVSGAHAGRNFFLDRSSIGKPRAEALAALLAELNDEVSGSAVVRSPADIIASSPDFFRQFSLVIATELPENDLRALARICWDADVALVVARAYGFTGYARIVRREHTIIEAHRGPISDFRFDCPFPALASHVASIDHTALDSMASSHLPFVVILIKALAQWRASHNGALPANRNEQAEFKQLVSSFKHPQSVDDENIVEAVANAYRAYTPTKIPADVAAILADPAADSLSPETPDFWLLVAALKRFVAHEGNGLLPVAGSLPDMKSDTDSFVKLQQIYRAKAREDTALVRAHLDHILVAVGRSTDSISDELVDRFCKNSSALAVIRYRSLEDEYTANRGAQYAGDDHSNFYWMLRAADRFRTLHGRLPGTDAALLVEDADKVAAVVADLRSENGLPSTVVPDSHITELVRAGGCELHNIAAIMGGIVSQEVIKLLTHQYVPANHTVVFNGVPSSSSVYQF